MPQPSEPQKSVEVHHHHYHEPSTPVRRREMPVVRDPLASYDALGRKMPKPLGFFEFCRAIPGFIGQFPGRVPEDRWVRGADGQAIFDCVCGEVIEAFLNAMTECPGACGRTFVFAGMQVLVRREEPEDEGSAN